MAFFQNEFKINNDDEKRELERWKKISIANNLI
jgi:hypothetical protein